jgi:broad specificity phosphatase PhoE
LVRHGETAWSISGQHTGHTNIPLTGQGERDAQVLGAQLTDAHFGKIFTRPLQRAWRTTELAGLRGCAQPDPDLMEWD